MVLFGGSISSHSEVVKRYKSSFGDTEEDVSKVAHQYGQLIRGYTSERAAASVLGFLGLSADLFVTRNRELDPGLARELADDMRSFRLGAEALIVGCDDHAAHLYHVDQAGNVTCHDEIGFVSAGIGGVHSSAEFMFSKYTSALPYYDALYAAYSAKRRAEAAPGCGSETDMWRITTNGIEAISREMIKELDKIFLEQKKSIALLIKESTHRLMISDQANREQLTPVVPPSDDQV